VTPPERDEAPTTPKNRGRPAIGEVIDGKYSITGVLGEGGTGIVYEAEHDGKRVALKVIHGHLLSDKQIRGRFVREAKILRRLSGPHLLPVLEFGEVADPKEPGSSLLYLALEKVNGRGLDQILREDGAPSIERVFDITLQIADALASAHAQGVIHRDLKPANVLLEGDRKVVVVDFGMAKIMTGGGTGGTTELTAHNMVFGTPEYMAPEQARGDELDARCDVYAVGIILYELLTGAVPFKASTPLGVLTAQLTAEVVPPRTKRELSPALDAVVVHALAKDPEARYPSATALASALKSAREKPDDVDAVSPAHFSRQSLVHATTVPAPEPNAPSKPTPVPVRASIRTPTPAHTSTPVPPPKPASKATWIALWALAVGVGIAIGVWLSLR
jgi:serine/threonine-protein kinase